MAITQAMCTSFKTELLTGTHDFTNSTGNTFKIALFRATASIVGTYGAATTNYSDVTGNSDEASGTGYSAGGNTLTNVTPTSSGTTAFTDFVDTTWSTATITASGALIYNSSASNAEGYGFPTNLTSSAKIGNLISPLLGLPLNT